MFDYKESYLTMMRETEKAIRILINAQLKCEELYLKAEGLDKFEDLTAADILNDD